MSLLNLDFPQEKLPKYLPSLSYQNLTEHWELYKAHFDRANAALDALVAVQDTGNAEEETKQRATFRKELGECLLHQYFFESLHPDNWCEPRTIVNFSALLGSTFSSQAAIGGGDYSAWEADLHKLLDCNHEPGWLITYWSFDDNKLHNGYLLDEAQFCSPDCEFGDMYPLLVIDMAEHSFIRDYRACDRHIYLESVLRDVSKEALENRALQVMKFYGKLDAEGVNDEAAYQAT